MLSDASHTVYIGLGSNVGDKQANLNKAILLIDQKLGKVSKASHLYNTKAWGNTHQPDFLNQVIELRTSFKVTFVLHVLLEIELKLGRIRTEKWGPRTIDLDILFFDNTIINTPDLIVPHPEIQNRKFVLLPLCEIAPDFKHPILKKTNKKLLKECLDPLEAVKI
ncbi:MAG: 2-amino-4-hydroxy-6-hydroxymethyldihydropteridine diphosphokinase [Bacteroidota bacterium]|nr:2-amino-4-hydroxy-6-hydroxymethyldihydropteridine diphosphokinase [Bacteroidota bacterium]